MRVEEIKEKIESTLQNHNIAFAGVFGSVARGEDTPASDVDVLVRFKSTQGLVALIKLEQELSKALGRNVDIVTEKALHPLIKQNILRDLQTLYGER